MAHTRTPSTLRNVTLLKPVVQLEIHYCDKEIEQEIWKKQFERETFGARGMFWKLCAAQYSQVYTDTNPFDTVNVSQWHLVSSFV